MTYRVDVIHEGEVEHCAHRRGPPVPLRGRRGPSVLLIAGAASFERKNEMRLKRDEVGELK